MWCRACSTRGRRWARAAAPTSSASPALDRRPITRLGGCRILRAAARWSSIRWCGPRRHLPGPRACRRRCSTCWRGSRSERPATRGSIRVKCWREVTKGVTALNFVLFAMLALMIGIVPAAAAVEQCRFIQAKPEREACYTRQEAALAAKRKPEPSSDTTTLDHLQQMRRDDDAVYRSLRSICRGG